MKINTFFIIFITSLIFSTTVYAAKITRSCTGSYEMTTLSLGHDITFQTPSFTGTGSCGKLYPNRCRIRANDNLYHCMLAHYNRWIETDSIIKPYECTPDKGVNNYTIIHLREEISKRVCEEVEGRAGHVKINLYMKITGGKGCSKKKTLYKGLGIDCPVN